MKTFVFPLVAAVLGAGIGSGVALATVHPAPGERGPAGPQGPAGPAGKVSAKVGVCVETEQINTSTGYRTFVVSVISPAVHDGVVQCLTGTLVQVEPVKDQQ